MKNKSYILAVLMLVFIAISVRQYMIVNKKQREETADFIYKQIILCGKSIEDASITFEESVKYEFSSGELKDFFLTTANPNGEQITQPFVDNEIKRIRRFYSRNQILISKITIFNDSLYRSFERNQNNYFTVLAPQLFQKKVDLCKYTELNEHNNQISYTQPIRNEHGLLIANITFDLNINDFLAYHFDKFYIGKNSWYWVIDSSGQILDHKYSEPEIHEEFTPDGTDIFKSSLKDNLSASLQHTIHAKKDMNAYSVFYPVNILGKRMGIVFSVNTDTLWKNQNESSIIIFVSFLLVIISVIGLFSMVIKQMIKARKSLESRDVMLRDANLATEILLTNPDFDSSLSSFLEKTAKALGYHRAYLIEYTQMENSDVYRLKHEWCEQSLVKPLGILFPRLDKGIETHIFQQAASEIRQKRLVKLNEPEFDETYSATLASTQCKALVYLPVYEEGNVYGILGYEDCIDVRVWHEYEDALFENFANALGGALAIQRKNQELVKAKILAETANKAKSAFLASISHEIKTPLHAVIGYSQLIAGSKALTDIQKEYNASILNAGNHLLSLINDILDLSKIEAGRLELNPENTDLSALFNDIQLLFEQSTQSKRLKFSFEVDANVPRFAIVDHNKLRRIFVNLIGNAIKFTQEGSVSVRISYEKTHENSGNLKVKIEDTGSGIPENEMHNLFKHFVQTSVGLKQGTGSGLGLALSKELCMLLGGNIQAQSREGKGSVFTFDITLKEGTFQIAHDNRPKKIVGIKKKPEQEYRILVVDDAKMNHRIMATMLKTAGFSTEIAENGHEAILIFEQWNPQLILMDLNMPIMDGYEATLKIKSTEKGKHTRIILQSASSFEELQLTQIAHLVDGYIGKPFTQKALFESIGNVLGIEYLFELEPKAESLGKYVKNESAIFKDISKLSSHLIIKMQAAIEVANMDLFIKLVRNNHEGSSELNAFLLELANDYNYSFIQEILKWKEIES